jgi:hypothetical protein
VSTFAKGIGKGIRAVTRRLGRLNDKNMTDPRSHGFIGRDGLELAYLDAGTGRLLVLLHGFLATGRQWIAHGSAATPIGFLTDPAPTPGS